MVVVWTPLAQLGAAEVPRGRKQSRQMWSVHTGMQLVATATAEEKGELGYIK